MSLLKNFRAAVALACLSLVSMAAPANAAAVIAQVRPGQPNYSSYQVAQANATDYVNSTVTPSDIAEATVTVPASKMSGATEYVESCFYAQAIKATSTTGTITVFVNGVSQTLAARTIASSAGANSLGGCYVMARPVKTSFVVKLQGVSGDTAAFTVNDVQLVVSTFFINS